MTKLPWDGSIIYNLPSAFLISIFVPNIYHCSENATVCPRLSHQFRRVSTNKSHCTATYTYTFLVFTVLHYDSWKNIRKLYTINNRWKSYYLFFNFCRLSTPKFQKVLFHLSQPKQFFQTSKCYIFFKMYPKVWM